MIELTNSEGVKFHGFQPRQTNFHANPDAVVMTFTNDAGEGLQIVLPHQSFKDFLLGCRYLREQIEAKQEYKEVEE